MGSAIANLEKRSKTRSALDFLQQIPEQTTEWENEDIP